MSRGHLLGWPCACSNAKESIRRGEGRGYRVQSPTVEDIIQAVEVRGHLEGLAARLTAQSPGRSDHLPGMALAIKTIDTAIDELACHGGLDEAVIRRAQGANKVFHSAILSACGNDYVGYTCKQISHLPMLGRRINGFRSYRRGHTRSLRTRAVQASTGKRAASGDIRGHRKRGSGARRGNDARAFAHNDRIHPDLRKAGRKPDRRRPGRILGIRAPSINPLRRCMRERPHLGVTGPLHPIG